MLAGEILLDIIGQRMSPGLLRSSTNAGLGVAVSILIYFIVRYFLKAVALKTPLVGNLSSLVIGLFIGVFVSVVSGVGYGLLNGYQLQFENFFTDVHFKALVNVFPALSEEIVFRGSIVNAIIQLAGNAWGIAAGSIPFGILHLLGVLFGNTVTISQIFGISFAGMMLSLVYVNFGVCGAFACHLVWNSLVTGWIKVYGIEDKAAISSLEGSWVTCTALLITSILLAFAWRARVKADAGF